MRGLLKLTFHEVQLSFCCLYGNAVFSEIMSSNLFKFLLAHLRFDDKTKRELWKQDHFLAMRDIFQIFAGNCKRALVPEEFFP